MERKSSIIMAPFYIAAAFIFMQVLHHNSGNAIAAAADSKAPKESCITDKCHTTIKMEKFVHGPIATGECTVCHVPIDKHKFKPITEPDKLCYQCHEKIDTLPNVHRPIKDGKCTSCHDSHQSPNKYILLAAGEKLCYRCHNKASIEGKFMHGPTAVGSCGTCHFAHQGEFPKLLKGKGNDVCFTCHTDKIEAFQNKKFTHDPVAKSCVACHNPHSGNFKYFFKADGNEDICFNCHKDKKKEIGEAIVKHKGLETDKKCIACHDPHVSDHPKQLLKQPAELCIGCHDREYTSKKGKLLNMKELLATNSEHHGPIKKNDCSSCHNTHGSKYFRILREYFPPLFYAGYNKDNYKFCFMCHENTLASEKNTTTLTSFRNGSQNLHFVHVNKAEKGRTCRACHDAHATNNPRHIRDGVPFGTWKLPVGFTKTQTGGQCLPGCHKLFLYDRNNPVKY